MAFEIRIVDRGPIYGGSDPVVCRFTDVEWLNLLSLAHECGFDAGKEYVSVVYPEGTDEAPPLDDRLAGGLYIGVNTILNQDTLPFATTWESDDGRLYFRWANTPGYAQDRIPDDGPDTGDGLDFDLDREELRRLLESLEKTRVLVARVED